MTTTGRLSSSASSVQTYNQQESKSENENPKIFLLQGYTFDLDLNNLKSLGVPADKIVYGIMPGHSDARK